MSAAGAAPARRGRTVANLGLFAVSLLVAAVLAEAAVRVFDLASEARAAVARDPAEVAPPPDPDAPLSTRLVHPFQGWVPAPGGIAGGRLIDSAWSKRQRRQNLHGFFSEVTDYRHLDPDEHVVAVFGGSFAEELVLYAGDTLAASLGAARPELAGRVRVVSAAAGGYKQPQPLAVLAQLLVLGVPLDAVVELDGFNEAALGAEDAAHGYHPLFPSRAHYTATLGFAAGALTRREAETVASVLALRERARQARSSIAGTLLAGSELARAALGVAAAQLDARAIAVEARFQAAAGASREGTASLPDPCLATADCDALVADLWARSSRTMAALAAGAGATYLHVLQPNQYVDVGRPLTDEERRTAYDPDHPWSRAAARVYPLLQARGADLRAAGVDFHDLTAIYAGSSGTLYRDVCCHVTVEGYRILATEVGRLLGSAGL